MFSSVFEKIIGLFEAFFLFINRRKFFHLGKENSIGVLTKFLNPEFIQIGNNITIGSYSTLYALREGANIKPKIVVEDNVYIGHYTSIHSISEVILEKNVVISDHVYISNTSHGFELTEDESILNQPPVDSGKVHIKKGTFVGHGCKILPGVTLGKHCMVGAGSVVTKSFDDYSIIVGNPARFLRKRV